MMVLDRSIGLISTLILARLLIPEDFGVVAMCMSVIAGLQLFMAFGFDVVLIQKQDATRDHYDTVFTLNIMLSLVTCGAVATTAGLTAAYYDEPRVVEPMYVLSIAFLVRGFENIKVVDFRKDLEFRKEAVLRIAQKLCGFCVTIPLAFYLRSYWALVFGVVALNIASVFLSYIMKPYVPRLSLRKIGEIFDFSSWLLFNNFLIYLDQRFSDFVIGRQIGAGALGLMNISREVAATPATQLVAAANRAIYPGYAKLAEDTAELARTYLSIMCAISIVVVPIGLGIASVAELVVSVALGEKWAGAAVIVGVLGLYSVLEALLSNTNYIFYALAIPRQLTYFTLAHVCLLLPTMYFFVSWLGIEGAAWAMVATNCVSLPMIVFLASRYVPISLGKFMAKVWRAVIAGLVMYFVVRKFQSLSLTDGEAVTLVASILVGAVTYGAALIAIVTLTGFRSLEEWKYISKFAKSVASRVRLR